MGDFSVHVGHQHPDQGLRALRLCSESRRSFTPAALSIQSSESSEGSPAASSHPVPLPEDHCAPRGLPRTRAAAAARALSGGALSAPVEAFTDPPGPSQKPGQPHTSSSPEPLLHGHSCAAQPHQPADRPTDREATRTGADLPYFLTGASLAAAAATSTPAP